MYILEAEKNSVITEKLQELINNCGKNGGGRVVVPAGRYIIGTIELLDNIELHLERGAVLQGSENFEDFKEIGYFHNEMGEVKSMLYGIDREGISITGFGTIDINGNHFYDFENPVITDELKKKVNDVQLKECPASHTIRLNQPMFFLRCNDIVIKDVKIINSPTWGTTFVECKYGNIDGVKINHNLPVPNSDGIHLCSSKYFTITNCIIESGDDCIALSGITDWNKPCEDIVISNSILKTSSKALSIGYMHSIVRNVTISNIIIKESNRGISLMANPGTSLIEDITFNNIHIDTKIRAGNWWGNGEPITIMATEQHLPYAVSRPEDRFDINVRNITFSNIKTIGENVSAIVGEKGRINGVLVSNYTFSKKESLNIPLKGKVIDLAPGPKNFVVEDGVEFVVSGGENIEFVDCKLNVQGGRYED